MKQKNDLFANAVSVVNDISIVNTLYLIFSFSETGVVSDIGYLPWFSCGLLGYFINYWFLKKPRTIPAIAFLNGFLYAAEALFLYLVSGRLGGALAYAFAAVFLLITVCREYYLVLHPVTPQSTLTHTEGCVILVLFLYFFQIGGFEVPVSYNVIMFLVLLLNIAAMIKFRISSEHGNTLSVSGRWAALIFGAISLALAVLLLLYAGFLSGAVREATTAVLAFIGASVKFIFHLIGSIIMFLISLLPPPPTEEGLPPEQPQFKIPEFETSDLSVNETALMVLGALAVAAVIALIAFLLMRFRHTRISSVFGGERLKQEKVRSDRLSLLRRLINAARERLKFFVLSVVYRKTPVGLLLSLQRFGKRRGLKRLSGETHKSYLTRLAAATDVFSGEDAPAFAQRLCDELDFGYYSENGSQDFKCRLSPHEISHARIKIRKAGGARLLRSLKARLKSRFRSG